MKIKASDIFTKDEINFVKKALKFFNGKIVKISDIESSTINYETDSKQGKKLF